MLKYLFGTLSHYTFITMPLAFERMKFIYRYIILLELISYYNLIYRSIVCINQVGVFVCFFLSSRAIIVRATKWAFLLSKPTILMLHMCTQHLYIRWFCRVKYHRVYGIYALVQLCKWLDFGCVYLSICALNLNRNTLRCINIRLRPRLSFID